MAPTTWRVDKVSNELPYFPERWLAEWLEARGQPAPVYAFAKSGARPLTAAYRLIVERYDIDLVALIDGGTDSVLFGDEPGLGSVDEDAISSAAAGERVILAAIGFGIDHFHGVSLRIPAFSKTRRVSFAKPDFSDLFRSAAGSTGVPILSRPCRFPPIDASRCIRASRAIPDRETRCAAMFATTNATNLYPPTATCSSTRSWRSTGHSMRLASLPASAPTEELDGNLSGSRMRVW